MSEPREETSEEAEARFQNEMAQIWSPQVIADAKRYRWLRAENAKGHMLGQAHIEIVLDDDGCEVESGHAPGDLDAAIDERIANQAEGKQP